MPTVPKLKVPFAITTPGGVTAAATVEQDSVAEIAQCVWAILATRPGQRPTDPAFGLADQTHRKGGADLEEIRTAVEVYEPRAAVLTDAQFEGLIQKVEVTVDRVP